MDEFVQGLYIGFGGGLIGNFVVSALFYYAENRDKFGIWMLLFGFIGLGIVAYALYSIGVSNP